MTIYCGRDFSAQDIQSFRDLMVQDPTLKRLPLSRQLCELRLVIGIASSHLCNEFIARYHYPGITPLSGSQWRYNVFVDEQLEACISFGTSAWKLNERERFIGWQEHQRQKNLQLVVNNARFLILPWIRSKGLASKILSRVAHQLPQDWFERYGFRPVLLETLVEFERHKGTCYKAANWIHVGRTAGRGKSVLATYSLSPSKTFCCTRSAGTLLQFCVGRGTG